MCGIAGAWFFRGGADPLDQEAAVGKMVEAMGHRGPDGRGVVRCTSTDELGRPVPTLGHARLSIIDLSERGRQPMASPRRPIWVTYNGEIYNFQELRRMLEHDGCAFHSESDTEVLLQGYEKWGRAVVDRLRGMFAFAIWDGTTGELLLARDRLGIKPMYVYRDSRCLLFASEVRALLASGVVPRRLDLVALDQFLAYQSVPAPRTLVRDVAMLRAGRTVLAGASGSSEEREYWDPASRASTEAKTVDRLAATRRIHDLLAESVRLHLVSDVPVGVFLSGGIDSGALVSLIRQAGIAPRTFTVTCPATTEDEGPAARSVAEAFETDHSEIVLQPDDLCRELPIALSGVDHPSGDGINTFIVAKAVRQAGLKVALSGLGGDELFGGYPSFRRLGRLVPYSRFWAYAPPEIRAAAASAVRTLGGSSIASGKTAALLESDGSLPQMFPVMRQVFSRPERQSLLGHARTDAISEADPYIALLEDARSRLAGLGTLASISYAEARTYMHDVLLRDADQMSMRHGLEVRVPLLDHVLVEYLMGLSDETRGDTSSPKALLVESLGAPLPSVCLGPKRGFVLPFEAWMRGPLRAFCETRLGPEGLAGRGAVRGDPVQSIWRAFLAGSGRTTWSRPWTLVALDAWLEASGVAA